MKEKELAKFVDWLVQSGESPEGASFDETVSWINELATSEEGQQILGRLIKTYKNKEMGIFKEGGKLGYLLCLKKGGSIQDCGCGKKIEKNQPGGVVESDVSEQSTPITFIRRPRNSGDHFYDRRVGEDGTIVEEVAAGDDPNLSYIRAQYPATEGYPDGTIYYVGGYDESGYKSTDHFGFGQQKKGKKLFDENYQRILSQAQARELRQEYGPVGLPAMQSGGEISRRDALNVLRTTGSSNSESIKEYRDAKRDTRKLGLRGKDMRQVARSTAMARGIDRIIPALDDVEIEEIPISFEDTFANIEVPTSLGISIMDKVPVTPNDVIGGSFKEAFAEARKRNLKDFVWDNANAKYSRYSTALANSSKKRKEPEIITSSTPSYPVYMAPKDSGFGEKIKMAIINNAPYMK